MCDTTREALAKRLSEITAAWPGSDYLSLGLHKDELACIIASLQGGEAVPDGWQLVPRRATEDMLADGDTAIDLNIDNGDTAVECWCAMLAAAPPAPTGAS